MNVLMIVHFMNLFLFKRIAAALLSLLLCQSLFAQSSENQQMVFEGSLTDDSGNAIDLNSQQLFYYITAFDTMARKCILYAESSTTSGNSAGDIFHRYGSGNAVVSPVTYNNVVSNSIFSGATSGKLADGSGNSCSVAAAATRYVDVYSAVLDVTGSIIMGSTPYSQFANNANSLNGKSDADFISTSSVSGGTTGQVLSRAGANGFSWINLPAAASGGVSSIDLGTASATGTLASARLPDVVTSGTYTKVTVDSKGRVISSSALVASDIPNHGADKITSGVLPTTRGGIGMASIGDPNQILGVNSNGTALEYRVLIGTGGLTVSAGPGAITVDLNLQASHVVTALGYTPANLAGADFTGDTNILGDMGVGHNAPITRLDVAGSIRIGNGGETCTAIFAGSFRYNSGSMEFCNGASWQGLSIIGGGASPVGAASGDLTGTYPSPIIASGAVTSAKILDSTITDADISNTTITAAKLNLANGDIALSKIGNLTGFSSGSDTTVVAADNVLQAVSKLQGQINSRWQTMSSDMYFNTGNVTIGSNTFPNSGTKLFVKNTNGASNPVSIFEQWDNSAHNTTLPVLSLSRRLPASSTPQNGFGSSMLFMAEDSAKTMQGQAMIATQWVNAANGSSQAGIFIGTKDSSGTMTPKLYIDQSGLYSSNNIAVSGSVRIGSDGSNTAHGCSGQEGKQRYNSTYKAMEFCDGVNWRGLTGVTYCDGGYSMVGTAGTPSAFCMDTNVVSPQSYVNASNTCFNRNPSSGSKAKLCTTIQLDLACESYNSISPTLNNLNNGIFHWTSNSIPVGGSANYPKNIYVSYSSSNLSTCHIEPNNGGVPTYNGRQTDADYINNSKNYRCCYE